MQCCVQLPMYKDRLQNAVNTAKDYALSHGIVVRQKENPESAETVTYAPFLLFPSPVPKHCFYEAVHVQTDFNLLMHKVAHNYEFLKDALQHTIKVDDFTGRLWNIYETVRKEGISQPVSLALNRSDYMFDCGKSSEDALDAGFLSSECSLKQIEFNTMASSFGGLCTQLSQFHRMVSQEIKCCSLEELNSQCPENKAAEGLASGMIAAWEQYGNPKAVLMFLVYPNERNVYDQRFLEFTLKQRKPGVSVIRRSIQDLSTQASLGEKKELIVDGNEVAVCYFRMGYTPKDFHNEKDWESRLLLERSKAIKCPNVYYHLAGTKKVQQVLARPGVLEGLLTDPVAIGRIRKTFAGQYSLDMGEEGEKSIQMAMENPHKFVLKPQREGGGNNTFGEEIRDVLKKIGQSEERTAYILMERIHPAPLNNYALRSGSEVQLCDMVSELGIFGMVVGTKDDIIVNKQQGHILRTKTLGTDEGGVAAGFAALDSPYLI